MPKRCYVATRKGLFTVERGPAGWAIERTHFLGDNCTLTMHDPRTGHLFAALNHGHFGVKLHRSEDNAATWIEIAAPQYPPVPEGYIAQAGPEQGKTPDWSLKLIWSLAPGGASQPGVLWCGTLPGGLFRSTDNGNSWELNRPLWDNPLREAWMGGGADQPGIHSICVDPRDPRHIILGVSQNRRLAALGATYSLRLLHTRYLDQVLGRNASRDIARGTPLDWDCLTDRSQPIG